MFMFGESLNDWLDKQLLISENMMKTSSKDELNN